MSGVPLDQLRCPTCGVAYRLPLGLQCDPCDPLLTGQSYRTIEVMGPRYVVCPGGHRWTVKTVTRSADRPDDVQLDRYIGDEGLS